MESDMPIDIVNYRTTGIFTCNLLQFLFIDNYYYNIVLIAIYKLTWTRLYRCWLKDNDIFIIPKLIHINS